MPYTKEPRAESSNRRAMLCLLCVGATQITFTPSKTLPADALLDTELADSKLLSGRASTALLLVTAPGSWSFRLVPYVRCVLASVGAGGAG